MGFNTADMPPVDPAKFGSLPFMERMRLLATHWCEYGFGSPPKKLHMLYVYKLIFFTVVGLLLVGLTTPPALGGFGEIGSWWTEPIVYVKLMAWTTLFEVLGLASSSGPLAFKFSPFIGGCLYWLRPPRRFVFHHGRARCPSPPVTPVSCGTWRSTASSCSIWRSWSASRDRSPTAFPAVRPACPPQWAMFSYIGLIVLMGLRDKTVFLAARSEQYLAALLIFASAGSVVEMIIAAKIFIFASWFGAGISKLGRHFTLVVAPMVSNTPPWITSRRLKRSLYRNFPEDIRASKVTSSIAHILAPSSSSRCR